ncbi:MAG TPA: hypothetical protein VL068_01450 [Microthrixaceae bacterium]|nr:hypothetical protein [Microthrixaceae bacterium]
MALIRATCSDCGDVELRSRDLRVRTCIETADATYLFRCPVCRMIEVRPAEQHVVDVLVAAGVREERWHVPAEMGERPSGEVIDHDDVLDFHDLLSTSDWFETLATMTER